MLIGTISILFVEVLILTAGFITSVFLARKLGPTNFGLFSLTAGLVNWIEWTTTSLFTGTTIKFISETSDWRPVGTTVLRMHLVVGGVAAALIWLLSSPLSNIFNEPAMTDYLKLFAIDIPVFALACTNLNILMGRGFFKERARISGAYGITRLVLIILFVELGLSVRGAILGCIGASVIELVISRLFIRVPLFSGPKLPMRRLLGFSVPLFMSSLSQHIFRMELVVLKVLGGTGASVGFYSAAQSLSIPPNIYAKSLSPPLLSTLSHLLGNREEATAKHIGLTALRSALWLLPFAAMTAGAASEIVCFVFGKDFVPAAPILASLIFATLGLLTIHIAKAILVALGKVGWTFAIIGPMVPVAIIGRLILIPRIGGTGAALVTTFVAWLGALVSVYMVCRTWRVLPPVKSLLKSTLCSGIAFALAILWPVTGVMIVLKLAVIILIILLTFLLLGEFTASEIATARSMFKWRSGIKQSTD